MLDNQEYEETRQYLEKLTNQKIRHRRVRAIGVNPPYHGQPKRLIEVGKYYADLEPDAPSELVVAIYESRSFCVCTATRGAGDGLPYFFTRDSVYIVEYLE